MIETVGRVVAFSSGRLEIQPRRLLKGLSIGESIAVDGVCLTVDHVVPGMVPGTRRKKVPGTFQSIAFRLLPETVRVSTLGKLRVNDQVNLERALRVGDSVGGHLLLGHVDGQGLIVARISKRQSLTIEMEVPSHVASCLVPKGPIAVDGVSLTLDPEVPKIGTRYLKKSVPGAIRVHLVAHTVKVTTLGKKPVGSRVNIEADLIAKYLLRMLY